MPSSFVDSVPPIIKLLVELEPRHVLDVGPGWGKYGLMCREYLPTLLSLTALEVPEGRYLPGSQGRVLSLAGYLQEAIYDHVVIEDVRSCVGGVFSDFDLVLMIDIIEHMTLCDGHQVLDAMQGAGCRVLVSTPKIFMAQEDPDNPYETHRSLWSSEDFVHHRIAKDVSTIDSIIYLLAAY